jgi:hypothetical protein
MALLPNVTGDLQTVVTALQQMTVQIGNLIKQIATTATTYLPLTGGTISGSTVFEEPILADGYTCRAGRGGTLSNIFNIFWTGSAAQLWIDYTDVGSLAFVSDYRIKDNVAPLPSMWDTTKALNPISYTEKNFGVFTATAGERWGFIADELQSTLIPNAATGVKDQENLIQSPNPWPVLAALTKSLQEAQARIEALGRAHYVRVLTTDNSLNNAVANGAVLRFDTIYEDTDGYAPSATPFSGLTIPAGMGGVYVINGWSSGSGNQSTTLGMGVLVNATQLTGTNQSISGPGSVNYTLDNAAVAILRLNDGDTVEMFNTSVSSGKNVFTAVFMSLARVGG